MAYNLAPYTFDELKSNVKNAFAMGPFGSNIKAENFVSVGIPVIKGAHLNATYLLDCFSDFVTEEKAAQLSASIARKGDIIITHRGTLGQVGLIHENAKYNKYLVSQSQLKLSFDLTRLDPYYVYYFLKSPIGQQQILSNKSQVGVPAIARALSSMKAIIIDLPELPLQRKIVTHLRMIDDRIDLLKQTNQTLEAIAQTIFKSWFVNFDPVHAKQQGMAFAGIDAETAELFPDSFEDSELGLIPKGWRYSILGEYITKLSTGRRPKGGIGSVVQGIPSIGAESITRIGEFDFNKTKFITQEFYDALKSGKVQSNDVLGAVPDNSEKGLLWVLCARAV
jgi:type I restriction enzyme, S subunit